MMQAHVDLKAAAVVAVEHVPPEETHRYGIVITEMDDIPAGEPVPMVSITEKPARGTVTSTLAVAARYIFSPAIFEALSCTPPDSKGEIQLTSAIKSLIQIGLPVYAWLFRPDERRYDIGNFESYFRTFIDFALSDERYGYLVRQYIKAKAYEL
jgi:UTP--glucose-1-phosphate uridylyltransferase